jgi:hypothetical protein
MFYFIASCSECQKVSFYSWNHVIWSSFDQNTAPKPTFPYFSPPLVRPPSPTYSSLQYPCLQHGVIAGSPARTRTRNIPPNAPLHRSNTRRPERIRAWTGAFDEAIRAFVNNARILTRAEYREWVATP